MKADPKILVKKLIDGNIRALAQVISSIEDSASESAEYVELLYPHTGNAYTIGVTGSPGVGKSTLVDAMVQELVGKGARVAVLAIDPSSPFSGGALLGDRIRMADSSMNGEVYIRSMATRGALGGLAPRASEAIFALDAAGYDYILVETVGVGQAEVEIVRTADTVVLVLIPGLGDGVQALKAGIIEIADVFAINKADYDGSDRLQKEIVSVLSLAEKGSRRPKIVKTIANKKDGVDTLMLEVDAHRQWAATSGAGAERKKGFIETTFRSQLSELIYRDISEFAEKEELIQPALDKLSKREAAPSTLAADIISKFKNS